jgi:hypothetical protein
MPVFGNFGKCVERNSAWFKQNNIQTECLLLAESTSFWYTYLYFPIPNDKKNVDNVQIEEISGTFKTKGELCE